MWMSFVGDPRRSIMPFRSSRHDISAEAMCSAPWRWKPRMRSSFSLAETASPVTQELPPKAHHSSVRSIRSPAGHFQGDDERRGGQRESERIDSIPHHSALQPTLTRPSSFIRSFHLPAPDGLDLGTTLLGTRAAAHPRWTHPIALL